MEAQARLVLKNKGVGKDNLILTACWQNVDLKIGEAYLRKG